MAKYDTTKFYWLQLKEDFFDEDAIDWLEEQPNGKEYSLFYLKLCLKSLRTNGILVRKVGNMIVPYDHIKLGELTKTNPDTVIVAMNLLLQIGLVEKLENGELYITQVENMIGSQSKGAFKKQQQRIGKNLNLFVEGGQKVDKCPPEIDIEIEKDIDINKEKESIEKESPTPFDCFIEKYSISCDNYSAVISEIDFDLLDKAFSESKWLQQNFTCLSKICKKYKEIIGGAYKDFVKPKIEEPILSDIEFLIKFGFSEEYVMQLSEQERKEKRKKVES